MNKKSIHVGSLLHGRLIAFRQSYETSPDNHARLLLILLDEIVKKIENDNHFIEMTITRIFEDLKLNYKYLEDSFNHLYNQVELENQKLKQELIMREKKKPKNKTAKVMHEFKEGKLHSGSKSGPEVTNPKQAIAIALSEQRKAKKK